MEYFTKGLKEYRASFLQGAPARLPGIACAFIGGSRLYNRRHLESSQHNQQSHYDGTIVLQTKHDVYSIISDRRERQSLLNLVGIVREEQVNLDIPSPSSPLYHEFDAIRISGYDDGCIRRSVTVLSLEYFTHRKTSLNILSYKDRRVYDSVCVGDTPSTKLVQMTSLDTLMILHDQWVYSSRMDDGTVIAGLGIATDLLLSGACVHGEKPNGRSIKRRLIEHYVSVAGCSPSPRSFVGYLEFSSTYKVWLRQELAGLCPDSVVHFDPSSKAERRIFLLGDTAQTQVNAVLSKPSHTVKLPKTAPSQFYDPSSKLLQEVVSQFNEGRVTRQDAHEPKFSRNSLSYKVTTNPPENIVDVFVKVSPHAYDELQAAKMASRFFPRILKPRMASSVELLYPYFSGNTESDLRLSYIQSGRQDMNLVESILYIELVRAEDTLRAYRSYLSLRADPAVARQNIQRLFHDRLVDDRRMKESYGQGMTLAGETFSLEELLSLRWIINGQSYPSLREAFDEARKIVAPDSALMLSCPMVFGLGDSHGGNVMFSPLNEQGGTGRVIFIDHEVARFHPVMLDLAKPLYYDVFYETLYRQLLPGNAHQALQYRICKESNSIIVDLPPVTDSLTQAILDIKLQYLVKPLCDEIRKQGGNLEDHMPVLANAMFLCATLGGNKFTGCEEGFLSNFATGLVLRKAESWFEYACRLEEFGFKARSALGVTHSGSTGEVQSL
ncbi:hypothetical protein F5Y14DRAFT_460090 [Nemania sp. NC0429]|nr:hypothetical protein F5Y14DRAFT_460090 [Nemania sp. NC0429]